MIPPVNSPLTVAFRADAALTIGTGHVMRCLTLADMLQDRGAICKFICRPHDGHLLSLIAKRGHQVTPLSQPIDQIAARKDYPVHAHWLGADWSQDAAETLQVLRDEPAEWLVVDHYALDCRWEQALHPACRRLMVIDDLADRAHICNLLLDQNLGRKTADYTDLIPASATSLTGPFYALLRPEFAQLRPDSLERRKQPVLKTLLISLGGVDRDNVTCDVLDTLDKCRLPDDLQINVVMGATAPWMTAVHEQAHRMHYSTKVYAGAGNMAQLMLNSDLAIGAAGGTSWERCCLGLPTIQIVLADNQIQAARALTAAGAALNVSRHNLTAGLSEASERLSGDPALLKKLSIHAAEICDGTGTSRVAGIMSTPQSSRV